ncbi:uncharacterized protein LOC129319381 isoform X3 [Prosopis cineraria]|uniref:uncharacterized protein LOC129319381 isoform X3 n=1 Tax=Prosopis cineraria TaxID=364024 RepID=UPI00240F1438|nr:uncharacterized protein LOC129319381 isoform X3 [Prosopis cineraria]
MALAIRQFLYLTRFNPHVSFSPTSLVSPMPNCQNHRSCALRNRNQTVIAAPVVKASAGNDSLTVDGDDGVSLGTMVLPMDTDLKRFESLLFQNLKDEPLLSRRIQATPFLVLVSGGFEGDEKYVGEQSLPGSQSATSRASEGGQDTGWS